MEALDTIYATAPVRTAPTRRPRVVEVVGPAGCGKTTLARSLCRRQEIGLGVELPRLDHVPHVLHHTLLLLPAYLRARGSGGWLTWKEMRSMTYCRAWPRRLATPDGSRAVTVLDHGPVFRLARLRAFGPRITRGPAFERWWERSVTLWDGLLDAVIALDAPDDVLVQRIRTRQERHRMKEQSSERTEEFLKRYRDTYREILARLDGPRVLRVDTTREGPDEIAARVCEELSLLADGAPR